MLISQKVYLHALIAEGDLHSVELTDSSEASLKKHAEYLDEVDTAAKFGVRVKAFICMVGYWCPKCGGEA